MSIDWSKAPKDATHYDAEDAEWMKKGARGESWYSWLSESEQWFGPIGDLDVLGDVTEYIPRPAKPVLKSREQLEDEMEYERSEREGFVRELEELEQKIIDLAESIQDNPARQMSSRLAEPEPRECACDESGPCKLHGETEPRGWDGVEWPVPVGITIQNGFGEHRTVIAHDGDRIVCRCEKSSFYRGYDRAEAHKLSPLKTQAEREKEEVWNEAVKVAHEATKHFGISGQIPMATIMNALYDAGLLRKGDDQC